MLGEGVVMRIHVLGLIAALAIVPNLLAPTANAQPDYTLFESGPVRPIALSPDKTRLFVVNTPDGYLEIYGVSGGLLVPEASVPVGLEPVAVAARNNSEVWVVNHLSDSISVVDVSASPPRVVRTLLVGDEPRDIVFAGPGGDRAFITTAHRGQHSPYPDGEYDSPGIGRADVWVFNAGSLGSAIGGTPLTIVTLFGDRPRALAARSQASRMLLGGSARVNGSPYFAVLISGLSRMKSGMSSAPWADCGVPLTTSRGATTRTGNPPAS